MHNDIICPALFHMYPPFRKGNVDNCATMMHFARYQLNVHKAESYRVRSVHFVTAEKFRERSAIGFNAPCEL